MPTRRQFLAASAASSAAAVAALLAGRHELLAATGPVITVYKDPSCGCCAKWCKHMEANGFTVQARDVENVDEVKRTMHVPDALQSCHTAVVGRYVVEGHVPADLVKKVLAEHPAILGLAAPGMPVGAPGMEQDGKKDRYDIIAFDRAGKTRVYATRGG